MKKRFLIILMVIMCIFLSTLVYASSWVGITSTGQIVDSITYRGITVNAIYAPYTSIPNYGSNSTYCCAAFVHRFYSSVYGIQVSNLLGPSYTPRASSGSFSVTSSPKKGDIVRWNTGTHWAIVKEANGNNITLIQQSHWDNNRKKGIVGEVISATSSNYTFFRYSGYLPDIIIPTNNDPIGYYDSGNGVDYNTIRITGWTFDPDEPAKQLYVHVYVGGNSGSANAERITKDINGNDIIANAYRQDVDDVHHCGAWHGIDTTIRTTKTGSQEVHIYAIDTAGGNNPELGSAVINIPADPEKPVISNVKITNITEDGYTVYCTVTDNHKLQRVSFPTWTTREENGNDQDDIVWHDYSNDLNTNSVTAWYRVKTSEHKNEHGYYRTHIYAYDQGGNWTAFGVGDMCMYRSIENIFLLIYLNTMEIFMQDMIVL